MSEWKEIEFSKMLVDESISYGIVQPGSHTETNSVPIIRVNNIKLGTIKTEDVLKVDKAIEEKYQRTRLRGGELLITVVGSIGECAIVPENLKGWNVARAVSVARIHDDFDKRFIKYAFKTEDLIFQMYGNTNDTVQPTLNLSSLKALKFNVPSLPEQSSIASILSSLDNKINLLHRQNATLEAMAETLFRQWFVEEAKEDWEAKSLSEIIDVVIDNRGKTPPTVEYETEHPLIEVNALNSNSSLIDYSVIRKYVSKEIFESWFRKHLNLNDVIISTVGTIGVFSIHLSAKGCIAQNLVGLRSKSVSGYFIYNFLKVNKENILNLDIGGVQPSIKVPHLLDLKMKLPSVGLIYQYHTTVDEYYKKIAMNSNQIRTLTALRDTLLPKLMSGEVRVEI